MLKGFFIVLVVIGLLYYIIKSFLQYKDAKMKYDEAKRKEVKRKERLEITTCGNHIINRPEFSEGIKKTLTRAVKVKVKDLRSTYFDCDEVNIWTTSIFTFQLQCLLEKSYRSVMKEEDEDGLKEFVRELIKTCHLEAVSLYPEQKETFGV